MKHIFLHGLGQNANSWKDVITSLPLKGIDAPELFHLSDDELTYPSLYNGLENYLEAIKEPFTLCGLSLGSVLALDYAIHHADRISSLILIAPQYKAPTHLIDLQNLIFFLMPKRSFSSLGMAKEDIIALTKSMRKLDFSAELDKLSCRTTIVCGEKDKANRRQAEKLSQLLPSSRLIIVPGAGHELNTEAPDKLSGIILSAIG